MEEIKGMSDAEARKWLMKRGYGIGEIDIIIAENSAPAPTPKAVPVKAAPVAKAAPKAAATKAASKTSN